MMLCGFQFVLKFLLGRMLGVMRSQRSFEYWQLLVRLEASKGRCQSKILNTWSGHRTAQIDPEKCRKINGRETRFGIVRQT